VYRHYPQYPPKHGRELQLKRKTASEEEEDISLYRRVRIRSVLPPFDSVSPSENPPLPSNQALKRLLLEMQNFEDAWPFSRSKAGAKVSMDFSTMQIKLEKGEYRVLEDFVRDATQMFEEGKQQSEEVARCSRNTEDYMWRLFAADPEWPCMVMPTEHGD
jgi:hypothetical protein